MAARAQFEQMRRALPPGGGVPGGPQAASGGRSNEPPQPGESGGMYL